MNGTQDDHTGRHSRRGCTGTGWSLTGRGCWSSVKICCWSSLFAWEKHHHQLHHRAGRQAVSRLVTASSKNVVELFAGCTQFGWELTLVISVTNSIRSSFVIIAISVVMSKNATWCHVLRQWFRQLVYVVSYSKHRHSVQFFRCSASSLLTGGKSISTVHASRSHTEAIVSYSHSVYVCK